MAIWNNPLDLNGNELRNFTVQALASDPGSPVPGQMWFNTTADVFRFYDGTTTIDLGEAGTLDGDAVKAFVGEMVTGNTETGITVTYQAADDTIDFVVTDSPQLEGNAGSFYLARANHTGTQSADTLTDGTTNHVFTAADDTKLGGIATGATANETDAYLLSRANHTGTQTASTISDFTTAVDARIDTVVGAAPAALDTLEELAAALGDDANFASTVTTQISGLDTRLDTIEAGGALAKTFEDTTVGDGSSTDIALTHNLGTNTVDVILINNSTNKREWVEFTCTSTSVVTLNFAQAPTLDKYRVKVVG